MKTEYKIIIDIIEEKARVLDVGCDDGTLMDSLKKKCCDHQTQSTSWKISLSGWSKSSDQD